MNIQNKKEQAEKAAANEMFLNKELEFDEESDEESIEKFDKKFDDESNNGFNEESNDKPDDESEQNNQARVGLTAICSTIHARKKLVRIFNGEVMVPKQQWDINRIFTTLTYHQKNKRLQSSYWRFTRFAFST